jgi:uncharacterized protein (TIGR03067 family)
MTKDEFVRETESSLKVLGALKQREKRGWQSTGDRFMTFYKSTFANGDWEEVFTVLRGKDGLWRIAGYQLVPSKKLLPGVAPKGGDWFTWMRDAARRAPAPLDDLQGEYVLISRQANGEKPFDESTRNYKLTIKGDRWILNPGPTATIKIDASKNPKWIDVGKYSPGIYKLEGNILTICRKTDASRSDRPTEFTATKENGNVIVIYKRSGP